MLWGILSGRPGRSSQRLIGDNRRRHFFPPSPFFSLAPPSSGSGLSSEGKGRWRGCARAPCARAGPSALSCAHAQARAPAFRKPVCWEMSGAVLRRWYPTPRLCTDSPPTLLSLLPRPPFVRCRTRHESKRTSPPRASPSARLAHRPPTRSQVCAGCREALVRGGALRAVQSGRGSSGTVKMVRSLAHSCFCFPCAFRVWIFFFCLLCVRFL